MTVTQTQKTLNILIVLLLLGCSVNKKSPNIPSTPELGDDISLYEKAILPGGPVTLIGQGTLKLLYTVELQNISYSVGIKQGKEYGIGTTGDAAYKHGDGTILYISTCDSAFISPEGITSGMKYREIVERVDTKPYFDVYTGLFMLDLPSGWKVASDSVKKKEGYEKAFEYSQAYCFVKASD